MPTTKRFSETMMRWMAVFMRRSTADYNRFMKELGISMPQFHTLIRIYFEGSTGVSAIADDVGFTKAASSQMIDRLVRLGLVSRTENPLDRRERQIDLTDKGRETIDNFIRDSGKWVEQLTNDLTAEQREEIVRASELLIHAAESKDGEAG